jgi:hypothetical protein
MATVKVKSGDNMSALAAKAGVSLAAMKAANPQIANPSLIRPGQVLNIPAAKPKAPVTPKPVTPTPVAPKPVAPTSGVIPGFTPYITPDPDAKKPGDPGFVGPVAPAAPVAPTAPVAPIVPKVWKKAGTVMTANGPVDVDINGVAKDDSVPIAASKEQAVPLKEERTMAIDTFKKTLALFFGETEMTQPWVTALYGVTSKYYKTGSTIDESLNLALQDVRNNPELAPFTKRFKGVYELQDKLAKGEVVRVPTIAEFFKSQQALGDAVVMAGLPELNNREFLGDVLGTGKSVLETTALISQVFAAIDNAPDALKADLQRVAPGVDRTSIAKAILMGKEGAAALNKQIAATSVFSASKSQGIGVDGLGIDMATAADYAARGFGYGESLTGFGNVARGAAPLERLTEISTGKAVTPEQAQKTMQQSIFENNVVAQEQIRIEAEREAARYGGRPGTLGSRSFASRNRANKTI